MSKIDSMRFKVCISSGDSEFYEHLKEFGPYYRSRRLIELARIGYSFQKGMAISAEHQAPAVRLQPPADVSSGRQQPHYRVGADATSAIASMLDSLDHWGTA